MLTKDGLYPLGDDHPQKYRDNAPLRGRWDGKPKRCPKAGEWYLSGAIIYAYRAHHDLTTAYHIAEIVRVRALPQQYEILEVLA